MSDLYTPTERIIITSVISVNIMLCIYRSKFYKDENYKNAIVLADPKGGEFLFNTINKIGYFNEGSVPSLMYTLLVFPYESVRKGGYKCYEKALLEINNDIVSRKEKYGYTLIKSNYTKQNKGESNILSHMRNAVSHASISFDGDCFIFSDINPHPKQKNINDQIIFKFHKAKMGFLIEQIFNALILVVEQIKQREAKRKLQQ